MAKVGDVFKVFTNTITIKVAGADNGGMLAMFLEEVPPKIGVPMHVHRGATETLFVLKDISRFQLRVKFVNWVWVMGSIYRLTFRTHIRTSPIRPASCFLRSIRAG